MMEHSLSKPQYSPVQFEVGPEQVVETFNTALCHLIN